MHSEARVSTRARLTAGRRIQQAKRVRPPGGGGRSIRKAGGETAVPDSGRWEDRPRAKGSDRDGAPAGRSAARTAPADARLRAALGGAAREHIARIAPRRLGKGVAQVAAAEPDVGQHAVVEPARRIASWRFLTRSARLLEAAPRAAGEPQSTRPNGAAAEMVKEVMAGMARSNSVGKCGKGTLLGRRIAAEPPGKPTRFPLSRWIFRAPIDK